MKKKSIVLMILGLMLMGTVHGYAEALPQTPADYLAVAASYEEKAKAQDEIIAKHERLKAEYPRRLAVNPKLRPQSSIRWMNKHCDLIINDAKKLQKELRDFAEWHRARAKELQQGQ